MRKIDKNTDLRKLNELFDIFIESINCATKYYKHLLNEKEIEALNNSKEKFKETKTCKDLNILKEILSLEDLLKPIFFKFWKYEEGIGSEYISWLKTDDLKKPEIISSTFYSDIKNTFCDSQIGIKYRVQSDGFLGACFKDAASLIESDKREGLFTISHLDNSRIVNSYNLATPLITPIQVYNDKNNNYKSKHNEIILDSKYIKPVAVICLNKSSEDLANNIAKNLNIEVINRYEKSLPL